MLYLSNNFPQLIETLKSKKTRIEMLIKDFEFHIRRRKLKSKKTRIEILSPRRFHLGYTPR